MGIVETDIIRRIVDTDEGVAIEVGPGEEGFGLEIRTVDDASKKYFGEIRLLLNRKEMVDALISALTSAAKEMK